MSGRPARPGRPLGQALAEFAMVIPVFLLCLYGIIEFGRYVYTVQVLNNAAREGARYAIVHGADSMCPSGPMPGGAANDCDASGANVTGAVRKFSVGVTGAVSFPSQTCPTSPTNPCWNTSNQRGQTVTVIAETTFTPILPLPIPGITVRGTSTLVVNH